MVEPLPVYQCVLCVHGVVGISLYYIVVMNQSSIMCMISCVCMNELSVTL